jgi:CRP/FNR family transcriptional regulator
LCIYKSLAAQKLSEEELSKLSISCLSVKFKKGDSIIKQGMFSTNVAFLKKGLAKIHITGPYHEQIVRIIKSAKYLGLPTTFGDKVNQYSVTAIDDSEVCFIDISLFRMLLRSNPDFNDQVLIELCQSELEAYNRCVNRTQKQIRGKIADVLLSFSDSIYNSDSFPLLLTQEEIGNMVDATRESVSRVLTEFAKDGIITVTAKQIEIINRKLLLLISANG